MNRNDKKSGEDEVEVSGLSSPWYSATVFSIRPKLFVTGFHVVFPMLQEYDLEEITLSQDDNPLVLKLNQVLALSIIDDLILIETKEPANHSLPLGDKLPKSKEALFLLNYNYYKGERFNIVEKTGNVFFPGYNTYSFPVNQYDLKGVSGGPFINDIGEVVGVALQGSTNISFVLVLDRLRKFIKGEAGSNCTAFINIEDCIEKEMEILKTLAEQGSLVAQYRLGNMYSSGQEVLSQDFQKAFKWWTRAAEQNHFEAQFNLGNMYHYGEGVEKDLQKAFEWRMKAAEQGLSIAQYRVGHMYYYGEGVEKDLQKAFEWGMKAAEQNYVSAQHFVGDMYYYGEGVEQDFQKAAEWWAKAASQGYPPWLIEEDSQKAKETEPEAEQNLSMDE